MTRIRRARADEAPVLGGVHLETALTAYSHIFPADAPPPTIGEVTTQWTGWLADEHRSVLVAEAEGSVVGTGMACPDDVEPHRGHISRLYVRPEFWGAGIGRMLYDACVDELRAMGFNDATLWTLEANTKARSWYERLGWTCTGETKVVFVPDAIADVRYTITL